jgi:hypothetical protein
MAMPELDQVRQLRDGGQHVLVRQPIRVQPEAEHAARGQAQLAQSARRLA